MSPDSVEHLELHVRARGRDIEVDRGRGGEGVAGGAAEIELVTHVHRAQRRCRHGSAPRHRDRRRSNVQVVDVLLTIERRRPRQIGAIVARDHVIVVADLPLLRPADGGIPHRTRLDAGRPGRAAVVRRRIAQRALAAVRRAPRVVPHHVDAPVGSHGHGAEPMEGVVPDGIVVDSCRRAPRLPAVRAVHEHHVGPIRGRVD